MVNRGCGGFVVDVPGYEQPMEMIMIKPLAFSEYIRRFGMEALLNRLEINGKAGIVYHREGIIGDYDDFDDIEELIQFIQTGKR